MERKQKESVIMSVKNEKYFHIFFDLYDEPRHLKNEFVLDLNGVNWFTSYCVLSFSASEDKKLLDNQCEVPYLMQDYNNYKGIIIIKNDSNVKTLGDERVCHIITKLAEQQNIQPKKSWLRTIINDLIG